MFSSQINISTGTAVNFENPIQDSGIRNIDEVRIFFECLFNQEDSLKNKNKFVFLFLQTCIAQKKTDILARILEEPAMADLHPSLIKSALIMTDGLSEIEEAFSKLQGVYHEIIKNY
ncbi:hypothetical protein [Chitinophaga silvisoli]|uniref:Uncharacterized protein n=1 Tax=Chitinophaga silvisoli TaxID=2291814 RepID=A0A3E1P762_9BACT|nr:hypothetical protein [Chitinophaga silvisoli]RFM36035.1 hypothetical protein DXN04_00530 [Chitinophaga silvisoli]